MFKCTLCPYTTVSQYHWRKHLRNHFPSKLHTCSQCSYFSDRKSNYIQHIRTHTGGTHLAPPLHGSASSWPRSAAPDGV